MLAGFVQAVNPAAVNAKPWPGGPSIPDLAALGVAGLARCVSLAGDPAFFERYLADTQQDCL